jgi:hypothetical protein
MVEQLVSQTGRELFRRVRGRAELDVIAHLAPERDPVVHRVGEAYRKRNHEVDVPVAFLRVHDHEAESGGEHEPGGDLLVPAQEEVGRPIDRMHVELDLILRVREVDELRPLGLDLSVGVCGVDLPSPAQADVQPRSQRHRHVRLAPDGLELAVIEDEQADVRVHAHAGLRLSLREGGRRYGGRKPRGQESDEDPAGRSHSFLLGR